MRLEVEGRKPINPVNQCQLEMALRRLRSYGPSSFASLTDEEGNYLQVAGGGVTCMVERKDAISGRHYRAYKHRRHPVFPDGTLLEFGGGKVEMKSNEWLDTNEVIKIFDCFLRREALPVEVCWRNITDTLRDEPAP